MQPVTHAITHVVFDIGGVLIAHVQDWREAHLRTDVPWDDHYASPEFSGAIRESVLAHMSGLMTPQEWYATVASLSEGRLQADHVEAVLNAWMYDDYPGASAVIEDIHAAGRVTATLSNTNPVHWAQVVATSPALQRIQHLHASHLLGAAKPDRAIFDAFERATGFERRGILFFDDVQENIDVALDYGWRGELIDHTDDPARQLREHLGRYGVLE